MPVVVPPAPGCPHRTPPCPQCRAESRRAAGCGSIVFAVVLLAMVPFCSRDAEMLLFASGAALCGVLGLAIICADDAPEGRPGHGSPPARRATCERCGTEIDADSRFCKACGATIHAPFGGA